MGGRGPCATLPPAPSGLLGGGDQRAVRCAGGRQLPGTGVGGVRAAMVDPRCAQRAGHAAAMRSSSSGSTSSIRAALPRLTATARVR